MAYIYYIYGIYGIILSWLTDKPWIRFVGCTSGSYGWLTNVIYLKVYKCGTENGLNRYFPNPEAVTSISRDFC